MFQPTRSHSHPFPIVNLPKLALLIPHRNRWDTDFYGAIKIWVAPQSSPACMDPCVWPLVLLGDRKTSNPTQISFSLKQLNLSKSGRREGEALPSEARLCISFVFMVFICCLLIAPSNEYVTFGPPKITILNIKIFITESIYFNFGGSTSTITLHFSWSYETCCAIS